MDAQVSRLTGDHAAERLEGRIERDRQGHEEMKEKKA